MRKLVLLALLLSTPAYAGDQVVHDYPQALQHELSHCVGWPGDHPGAR